VFAAFEAQAPGSLRVAVALLLYTGQRTSDVVNMKWSQFDGEFIEVASQQKTGEYVSVPCHKELKAVLVKLPRQGEYILRGERSDRLPAKSLQLMIRRVLVLTGHAGYGAHGLRKKAVEALVEAGAQPAEIMAISPAIARWKWSCITGSAPTKSGSLARGWTDGSKAAAQRYNHTDVKG
jgi:integrase